ncbi:UNVERIFIED_CONTAM: putative mitochondrial protein [Sesamum radiatum]|uniref:Mitochondrial protein n=1 Tax=Sesamum radiatum TaxID=300843 RepID=A0AAW2PGF8_SESRA
MCNNRRGEMLKEKLNYFGVGCASNGRRGGLLLLWRKDVDVWIQSFSDHHIDATVQKASGMVRWRFTGFYGHPKTAKRKLTWSLLRRLNRQSQRPWLCMGDFNEILSQQEKQGNYPRAPWQIAAFRECLADCNLNDLGCRGSWFTWCNRRESPQTISERLDRACCNDEWSSLFPKADVTHIHEACSDHAAVFLSTDGDSTLGAKPKRSRFRFEAAWVRSEDCKTVIEKAWKSEIGSNPTKGLMHKIRSCRLDLLQWNRSSFGHISGRIKELNEQLNLDTNKEITDTVRRRHDRLRTELEELLERVETMWKQRGKALWLKEGDRNISFFHATATERRQRQEIKKLKRSDGTIVEREYDIQQVILEYFSTMFSSTRPNSGVIDEIVACLEPKVSEAMNEDLLRPFTSEEVKLALDAMHPLKSPGPDDNVLVAYEVNHYLAHKYQGNSGHVSLKLDLSKAYDRVEWYFLERVLLRLGFDSRFVELIMMCVTSVSFSFMLNGMPFENLQPGRGLRQGDPLSPYLFLFCTEAFSGMIRQAEEGAIHGVRVCRNGPRVTHLLFADDTLIFCDANCESLELIRGLLAKFERGSGLQVNYQKSVVVFSRNVPLQTQADLANLLGVVRIAKHEKYLGLPSTVGRSKRETPLLSELESMAANFFWTKIAIERSIGCPGQHFAGTRRRARLGFKILRLQNLALLAKQAWRLAVNPQGLAYSVLQANRTTPVDGWHAVECGDGSQINVASDPWLPRPPTFKLIASLVSLPPSATVSDLLWDDRSWNEGLIQGEFTSIDAECILQISTSPAPTLDSLQWHFGPRGAFSVRSAYSLALRGKEEAGSSVVDVLGYTGKWRFIWDAKVPPKVRLFAWRCCKNALPTHRNLVSRGIHIEGNCLCCGLEEDGLDHVLRRCSFTRLVWALSHLPWVVISRMTFL